MPNSINIAELNWREIAVSELTNAQLSKRLPRAEFSLDAAVDSVKPMLAKVKNDGVEALYEFARQFDGVEQDPAKGGLGIKVSPDYLRDCYVNLDEDLRNALVEAFRRINDVHQDQLPRVNKTTELAEGAVIRHIWIAMERVGIYVPGGLAAYPSSVLMNGVAAATAKVDEIVLATPAQKEFGGNIHPTIAAAAYIMDITEVYAVGGVGAIGLFAYGVDGVEKVDMIAGPGNVYVAAAKQLVQPVVGIDSIAGPSEIVIIADETASPEFVAADMISQAEHDELAAAVLFTTSPELAQGVKKALAERVAKTKHQARIKKALEGKQSAIVLVNSLEDAMAASNAYGPEHLELQTANNLELSYDVVHAGAIFFGAYSPVPLGDYIAGSNHVLPTGGSVRRNSGLNVFSFLRYVPQIEYTKGGLKGVHNEIVLMANDEDLPAHGEGVSARFE